MGNASLVERYRRALEFVTNRTPLHQETLGSCLVVDPSNAILSITADIPTLRYLRVLWRGCHSARPIAVPRQPGGHLIVRRWPYVPAPLVVAPELRASTIDPWYREWR